MNFFVMLSIEVDAQVGTDVKQAGKLTVETGSVQLLSITQAGNTCLVDRACLIAT